MDSFKTEAAKVAVKGAYISLGTLGAISLHDLASILAQFAATFSGIAAGVYAIVSTVKLLWEWNESRKRKRSSGRSLRRE